MLAIGSWELASYNAINPQHPRRGLCLIEHDHTTNAIFAVDLGKYKSGVLCLPLGLPLAILAIHPLQINASLPRVPADHPPHPLRNLG